MPIDRDRDRIEADQLYRELRRPPKTVEEMQAEMEAMSPPLGQFTADLRDEFRAENEAERETRAKQTDELWRG